MKCSAELWWELLRLYFIASLVQPKRLDFWYFYIIESGHPWKTLDAGCLAFSACDIKKTAAKKKKMHNEAQ